MQGGGLVLELTASQFLQLGADAGELPLDVLEDLRIPFVLLVAQLQGAGIRAGLALGGGTGNLDVVKLGMVGELTPGRLRVPAVTEHQEEAEDRRPQGGEQG